MKELSERVAIMEKKAEHLDHRLTSMERHNEALQELKTTVEILALTNENQNKQIENQSQQFMMISESMKNINTNLTNLNHSHEQLHTDIGRMNDRVEKIETQQDNNKIDVGALAKNAIVTVLTSAIVAGIIYAITLV